MSDLTVALTVATALGCGIMSGLFFTFSTFVMRALEDVPAPAGVAAMQAINLRVINPWFMAVFLGTAVTSVATIVIAIANLGDSYAPFLIAGGVLYLVGSIAVTMGGNQPRNLALGELDPQAPETARFWTRYLVEWNRLNHVRTLACVIATGLEIGALIAG
jgi:uncharacterized membrane protein